MRGATRMDPRMEAHATPWIAIVVSTRLNKIKSCGSDSFSSPEASSGAIHSNPYPTPGLNGPWNLIVLIVIGARWTHLRIFA
eukprot:9080253-Pyramimonas_sp.AAC.3